MVWYEIVLDIIIVVFMLAVLVSIHEAGHLAMAKLFRVYCFEYSIGFGPKLLSLKRKGGETYFSIRAVPFGGYVAMYGEGGVPEGYEEPPAERSLEAIAKWKKCIILVAGVTLNFILGMVLIYAGDAIFPVYYYAHAGVMDTSTSQTISVLTTPVMEGETLSYFETKKQTPYQATDYFLHIATATVSEANCPILDSDVRIMIRKGEVYEPGEGQYVAMYSPSTLIENHTLASSIALYPVSSDPVPAELSKYGVTHLPQLVDSEGKSTKLDISVYPDGCYVDLDLTFVPIENGRHDSDYVANQYQAHKIQANPGDFRFVINNKALSNDSFKLATISQHYTFVESWSAWASDFQLACSALGQGVAALFQPNGFNNLSGIVGITAAMPQIRASGGARLVFFFSGLISINLAFFNLLPFPGLDGWQLLVTIIEGISRKKVPEKAKSIMSIIGLVLLMALGIAVLIKDIVALII